MEEHKLLTGMLLVALVVSVVGTVVTIDRLGDIGLGTGSGSSLTGAVTGEANLTITQDITITLTDSNINFGSGKTTGALATLDTLLGTAQNWNATVSSDNITVQNDGNVEVNLTIKSDRVNGTADNSSPVTSSFSCVNRDGTNDDGATCGSGQTVVDFDFAGRENEVNTCESGGGGTANEGIGLNGYVGFNESTIEYQVCGCMNSLDSKDTMNIGVRADIPQDAIGDKGATLTITAYANSGC